MKDEEKPPTMKDVFTVMKNWALLKSVAEDAALVVKRSEVLLEQHKETEAIAAKKASEAETVVSRMIAKMKV